MPAQAFALCPLILPTHLPAHPACQVGTIKEHLPEVHVERAGELTSWVACAGFEGLGTSATNRAAPCMPGLALTLCVPWSGCS